MKRQDFQILEELFETIEQLVSEIGATPPIAATCPHRGNSTEMCPTLLANASAVNSAAGRKAHVVNFFRIVASRTGGAPHPAGLGPPPGRTQKWKHIRISFPGCSVFSVVKNFLRLGRAVFSVVTRL